MSWAAAAAGAAAAAECRKVTFHEMGGEWGRAHLYQPQRNCGRQPAAGGVTGRNFLQHSLLGCSILQNINYLFDF